MAGLSSVRGFMLSNKAVKEYQEIYKREFGKELSDSEARIEAENFIRLFRLVYHPILKKKDATKR